MAAAPPARSKSIAGGAPPRPRRRSRDPSRTPRSPRARGAPSDDPALFRTRSGIAGSSGRIARYRSRWSVEVLRRRSLARRRRRASTRGLSLSERFQGDRHTFREGLGGTSRFDRGDFMRGRAFEASDGFPRSPRRRRSHERRSGMCGTGDRPHSRASTRAKNSPTHGRRRWANWGYGRIRPGEVRRRGLDTVSTRSRSKSSRGRMRAPA